MDKKDFGYRLAVLRESKGVSARRMSLDLGQGLGYITNIESGKNYPSFAMFFEICEYLAISPIDFLDIDRNCPAEKADLLNATQGLSREQIRRLADLARDLKRG